MLSKWALDLMRTDRCCVRQTILEHSSSENTIFTMHAREWSVPYPCSRESSFTLAWSTVGVSLSVHWASLCLQLERCLPADMSQRHVCVDLNGVDLNDAVASSWEGSFKAQHT